MKRLSIRIRKILHQWLSPSVLLMVMFHPLGVANAATWTWTGAVSGDWGDFRDWSPQIVPPAGADVVVNTGSVNAGARHLVLNSLTAHGTVSNVAQLDTPTLTVGGSLVASLINATTFNLSGGSVTGNVRVATGGTWSGGSIWTGPVEIQSAAVVFLTAGSLRLGSNVTLENHGTVEMTGGQIEGYEVAKIRNHGTWLLNGHATPFTHFYGGNEFHNLGLLRKTGGADPTSLANSWAFHLDAETRCDAGELRLAAASTFLSTGSHLTGSGVIRSTSTLNLTGNAVETVARLIVDGGTVVCTGEASITGSFDWLAGDVQGLLKVPAGSSMIASGEGFKRLMTFAEIQAAGTWRWDGPGPVQGYDRSKITILTGGLCDLTADGDVFSQFYGGHLIQNSGIIRRSVSAADASFLTGNFESDGRIEVLAGSLQVITNLSLQDGGVISGAGRLRIVGGTTTLTGTTTVANSICELAGGTLHAETDANGTLLGNLMEWSAGSISGDVSWNGIARTATAGFRQINGTSRLRNSGVLSLQGGGSIRMWENAILHNRQGATLHATGQVPITQFYGGNLVLNEGTMVLGASPGRMSVATAFTQSASGRLEVGVAGPGSGNPDFDILTVSGAATLAGTLAGTLVASLENGYNPSLGTEFEILRANPRVGTFDQL